MANTTNITSTDVKVIYSNKTIVITKKFAQKIGNPLSKEFNDFMELRERLSDFEVVVRETAKRTKRKTLKGLNYSFMEQYIARHDSELYNSSSDSLTMDEEDYKSLCKEITYDELARNGNNLIGEKVRIKGQIIQVSYDEGIGKSEYRVATKEDEFGLWFDDVVYLFYDHSDNAKLLEDDIITIYGEISGDYTYESVGGGNITIPSIAGVYVDLQN